jgi:hypothetical protein
MPSGNPKDFWTGLIYIAFGAGALLIARDYGFGTARKMGPAYFPSILSVILIAIGIVSLVRSLIRPGTPIGRFTVKGLLLVTGATVLFGLTLRRAGLIVAMPALVIVSAYASRRFRWPPAIALAAVLTAFCILIFLKGLGIPIPVVGPWLGG